MDGCVKEVMQKKFFKVHDNENMDVIRQTYDLASPMLLAERRRLKFVNELLEILNFTCLFPS